MIILGQDSEKKKGILVNYLSIHKEIDHIYIFYPEKFMPEYILPDTTPVTMVPYKEIIMYRTFYPLLEAINDKSLIVVDECMRTRNRSDLTYNCLHHYLNQCGHRIVFQYFPFIDDVNDFMILLDMIDKGRYKGKTYNFEFLKDETVTGVKQNCKIDSIEVSITKDQKNQYKQKLKDLFDNIDKKDPDTIPRKIHLFAGNFKRYAIDPERQYALRNKRFKELNFTPYSDVEKNYEYIIFDFPHRTIDFNDFLYVIKKRSLSALNTGLEIDLFYLNKYRDLSQRLEAFYAQAAIHQ